MKATIHKSPFEEMRQMKWDKRFLDMAALVASWSKDPSTQCGAVIVRPDLTVASVGYNGFPRGCLDDPEVYADRAEKYQRVIHAEVNAILAAAEPLRGYTMYTHPASGAPSCDRCTTCIIQAGITRMVHRKSLDGGFNERYKEMFERSLILYEEAGVEVVSL